MNRPRRNPTSAGFILAFMTFSLGCGDRDGGFDSGNGNEIDGSDDRKPFRDGWRVAADVDFIHTDLSDGLALIVDLTIGGRETNDNFANRGDIIVNFDGPDDRILIELRRFTHTTTLERAEEDFERLSLWAFSSSPGRPQDQDVEDDCTAGGWQGGCDIRVYYDGLSQQDRAGADIRVTLPADYRRQINIVTEDNIGDDDYFNRGDVCVSNLFASVDIETESGNVWVSLADGTTPSPRCSADQIQACEDWTVDDESGNQVPTPWAPECDCIAVGGGEFGRVAIENRDSSSSDVTVEMPEGLWASIRAENKGATQSQAGEFCEAGIDVDNIELDPTSEDLPWNAFAHANFPGEPAIRGAGFSVLAVSNECSPVAHTDAPEDFVGTGHGDEQESTERGNIVVCTDCITQTCDELIP